MRNKKIFFPKLISFLLVIGLISFGFVEGDKKGTVQNKTYNLAKTNQSGKQGDAYRMNINNLNIPINRVGTIAAVNIPPDGSLGRFGTGSFLFSGGFFMSGFTNGNLWAFGQASASLVENMTPGTPASGPNDPDAVMYVLDREDPAFSQSWIDWKTAVDKFGADFYDGDGDGQYNPVDKNGNGQWDADEDHPDLLGDKTAWCVYTDGQPGAQRTRYAGVNPQGIEVRQTVFAFASKGALGNIMFIRYRLKNSGLVAERLDSVIFGVWSDPDVGTDFENDLVGIDIPRNAGFTYNEEGVDPAYGVAQPCFMIDFFSGPLSYIAGETYIDNNGNNVYDDGTDTPLDTAFSYRGKLLGVKEFPGARNLDVSSFVHYVQSDPLRGDPNDEFEARNYMNGRLKLGEVFDPCSTNPPDPWGGVLGVDCSTLDPRFWYSGDPVTEVGWLSRVGTDQRQMTNVGPITLYEGQEIEILVAYIVGQGTDATNSVTVAREIDDGAQFIFDGNFRAPIPPPTINPVVESGSDFIDFVFPIYKQVGFVDSTQAWNDKYHSTNVYAYKVNSTQDIVDGVQNSKLYTSYQKDYFVEDVYKENAETGGIELLYPESSNKLDYTVYSDSLTGNIRLRVSQDPFTGGPLIKGKPYYFAFTSTAINYNSLIKKDGGTFGTAGDYYLSAGGFVAEVENVPKIITVVLGEDMYLPPLPIQNGLKVSGGSSGELQYDVVTKEDLTGDKYSISFAIDSTSTEYATTWNLKNETSGVVFPTSNKYLYGSTEITEVPTNGFIVKLSEEKADLDTIYERTSVNWSNVAVYYLAKDLGDDSRRLPGGGTQLQTLQNNYTKADKLRRVVLKFGQNGKAYRYLNGFVGANPPARRSSYMHAAGVVSGTPGITDPNILNEIGKLGEGYVDVPFTAWVEDENFGEVRQLAVGFLERKISEGGKPDGIWDPGTNVNTTAEYIFIFNQSYDPNGAQLEYTGNFPASSVVWSDLKGYTIPSTATATDDQRKIALSPFFDVLYTAAISRVDTNTFWSSGDQFEIKVENYPYTSLDKFEFQTRKGGSLSNEEEKALFESVNVYPNPLYGFNVATSYTNSPADEPFVTFSNLPEEVTIKVYSLSGQLLRTLGVADKSSPASPFLQWNLQNESGLRVASGMYFAIVTSPIYGEKVLKFAIIMPQKQIQKY
jgi:hypothetical protein